MAYAGPPFNNLDEEVIEHFHEYIEKRGFDNNLAEVHLVFIFISSNLILLILLLVDWRLPCGKGTERICRLVAKCL